LFRGFASCLNNRGWLVYYDFPLYHRNDGVTPLSILMHILFRPYNSPIAGQYGCAAKPSRLLLKRCRWITKNVSYPIVSCMTKKQTRQTTARHSEYQCCAPMLDS
jgi:hypothetical protein